MSTAIQHGLVRPAEYQRLVESMRIMLAIIAATLLLQRPFAAHAYLALAILGLSLYAITLLLLAAQERVNTRRRIFYWLDACWFLLLMFLAGPDARLFFIFLFFPVFFAVWRAGYRDGVELALFGGLATVLILALRDPTASWNTLIGLPLSLAVVGPAFMWLTKVESATINSRAFALHLARRLEPGRGFEAIVIDAAAQIAGRMEAAVALVAWRNGDGVHRVFCWDADDGSSELSENAAQSIGRDILSLSAGVAYAAGRVRHWWMRDAQLGMGPSGEVFTPSQEERRKLAAHSELVGRLPLMTVPLSDAGVGELRILVSGKALRCDAQSLGNLTHIVEQLAPSLENAYLREQLVAEAADTERARIGRDLHDSALQPYIGLKFALEALQRRATPDNPLAADLARLSAMATDELAEMREVIGGLRGTAGKGGALLSSAVRRQAARFGQLFGIRVEVDIEGKMPVNRRLAGELFHLVAEALSNIRRHTRARRAWISLSTGDGHLVLAIRNENTALTPDGLQFTPSSLAERAAGLGGAVEVNCDTLGTTVTIRVPSGSAEAVVPQQ